MKTNRLQAEKNVINLGNIKFGTIQEFSYDLKNASNEDLIIVKIVAGCASCTAAHIVGKSLVRPGESRTLKVTFSPGDTGKALKGLSVLYAGLDEPDTTELKLSFKAQVNG